MQIHLPGLRLRQVAVDRPQPVTEGAVRGLRLVALQQPVSVYRA